MKRCTCGMPIARRKKRCLVCTADILAERARANNRQYYRRNREKVLGRMATYYHQVRKVQGT